jgi:hypothetical protein
MHLDPGTAMEVQHRFYTFAGKFVHAISGGCMYNSDITTQCMNSSNQEKKCRLHPSSNNRNTTPTEVLAYKNRMAIM